MLQAGFGFVEFSPKRMEFGVDGWVEVDFDLVEDFWGGSDQPQKKIIRIDGVDCGVRWRISFGNAKLLIVFKSVVQIQTF